jgi:bifunctional UDP-N-acetylglucosamine pyrophosphorylase/glucosamine-1-phosphate N-acetyltransferase
MKKNTACIILAAGKGKRMKSAIPKVLHKLAFRPMLLYVLDLVKRLKLAPSVAVVGYKYQLVEPCIGLETKVAIQKSLRGTADAVREGLALIKNFKGNVLILYGDMPLLKKGTVAKLIKEHTGNGAAATMLVATVKKPADYGRILRDKYGSICGIVEEKDADDFQKGIKEINTGIVIFDKSRLQRALAGVRANNRKKEFYLTDVIGILYRQGCLIESVKVEDIKEALGINSRVELAEADTIMRRRINEELMRQGVSIVDPATAFISYGTTIGADTVIYPFTVIESNCIIGRHCSVGPFVHLREQTRLADSVTLGNFIEVTRSTISSESFVKHFGYIGDARIGRAVNIGAGVVTANFDGRTKHTTVIGDRAFIGSDTVLVAPVVVGRHAKTGAGSVVVANQRVPDGATVVGIPARALKLKKG